MNQIRFTITDNAVNRVSNLIKKDPYKPFLRISVDGGGCSGFMYKYEFTSEKESDDYLIKQGNASFLIDKVSELFLKDAKLDYVEELGAQYFQVINPKAKHKCGCGNSFSLG